jgi:putative membrane protein
VSILRSKCAVTRFDLKSGFRHDEAAQPELWSRRPGCVVGLTLGAPSRRKRRRTTWKPRGCCPPSRTRFGPTGHDEIQKGSVAAVSEERRPDAQAELANERTYLSWLRTGLALVAVGVAAEQVLPAEGIIWARQLIGVSLILAGVLTAGLARWRWQTVDRAMRAGRRIPQPILGYVVGAAIVLGGLATIVLLLRADAG